MALFILCELTAPVFMLVFIILRPPRLPAAQS